MEKVDFSKLMTSRYESFTKQEKKIVPYQKLALHKSFAIDSIYTFAV